MTLTAQKTVNRLTLSVAVISFNPAMDWVGEVTALQLGQVNRVSHAEFLPAGKGVNVAKVLAKLGVNVTISGFLGQENAAPFERLFQEGQITDRCIRVSGATRVNLKLLSQDGVTECNFEGMHVSAAECERFDAQLHSLMQNHEVFVVTGSLPKGVSIAQASNWLQQLVLAKKCVFFDASGDWLDAGLSMRPYLIKPNEDELKTWLGDPTISLSQGLRLLSEKGIANTVLSLGEKGAGWWNGKRLYLANACPQNVVSTVGAGDTLVAGLCYGRVKGFSTSETLAFAVALSSLSVTHRGVGEDTLTDVLALLPSIEVKITPLDDDCLA